jgi:hypothetical protein
VITHAALARTARHVVLDPIAFEVRDGAVIEFDRAIDNQNALRALEGFYPAGKRAEIRRDAIDLLKIVAPGAEMGGIEIGGNGVLNSRCSLFLLLR